MAQVARQAEAAPGLVSDLGGEPPFIRRCFHHFSLSGPQRVLSSVASTSGASGCQFDCIINMA